MNLRWSLILAAALSLPLTAQAPGHLRANIPFDFELSDITLPAGEYRITHSVQSPGYVQLESADRQHSAMVLSGLKWPSARRSGEVYLSFNRYDDRSFLADAVFVDRHCAVFKSKSERVLVTSRLVRTGAIKPMEVRVVAWVR